MPFHELFNVPHPPQTHANEALFGPADTAQDDRGFDSAQAGDLAALLLRVRPSSLSDAEAESLIVFLKSFAQVEQYRRSVDENGSRFLISQKSSLNRLAAGDKKFDLSARDIAWALHSESQVPFDTSFRRRNTDGPGLLRCSLSRTV